MMDQIIGVVTAYVDGACLGNPGPGGWGVVIVTRTGICEASGAAHHTTNNQMELAAAVNALRMCERGESFTIISDSKYVISGASAWMHGWKQRGWRLRNGDPVKNVEWWKEINLEVERRQRIGWKWVRGHTGDWFNERADALANEASAFAASGNGDARV